MLPPPPPKGIAHSCFLCVSSLVVKVLSELGSTETLAHGQRKLSPLLLLVLIGCLHVALQELVEESLLVVVVLLLELLLVSLLMSTFAAVVSEEEEARHWFRLLCCLNIQK